MAGTICSRQPEAEIRMQAVHGALDKLSFRSLVAASMLVERRLDVFMILGKTSCGLCRTLPTSQFPVHVSNDCELDAPNSECRLPSW